QNLVSGTVVLVLGVYIQGLLNYPFLIDHWAMYPLVIGISFIVRFLRTKNGLLPGILLIGISLLMIFSENVPEWLDWIYIVIDFLEKFWAIAIILLGILLLNNKKSSFLAWFYYFFFLSISISLKLLSLHLTLHRFQRRME